MQFGKTTTKEIILIAVAILILGLMALVNYAPDGGDGPSVQSGIDSTPATPFPTQVVVLKGTAAYPHNKTGAFHLDGGTYSFEWKAYYDGGNGSAKQRKNSVEFVMHSLQRDNFDKRLIVYEDIYAGEHLSGTESLYDLVPGDYWINSQASGSSEWEVTLTRTK